MGKKHNDKAICSVWVSRLTLPRTSAASFWEAGSATWPDPSSLLITAVLSGTANMFLDQGRSFSIWRFVNGNNAQFEIKDIDFLIVPKKSKSLISGRCGRGHQVWALRCLSTTVGEAIKSPTVVSLDIIAANNSPYFHSIFFLL